MAWLFYFGEYSSLFLSTIWLLVTGGVLVVVGILEKFWPEYRERLDRYIAPYWRRRLMWGGVVLLVYIAGFLAWKEEYTKAVAQQAEIERLKGRLENASELEQKVVNLTEREKELVRALSAMRDQLAPWRIHRRREFIQTLREAGPAMLNLNSIAGDEDASDLFADLHDLLIAGGWIIKDKSSVTTTPWKGVRVIVKNRGIPPTGAVLIVELLRENGIASWLTEHPTSAALTKGMFAVDIGHKP